MAPQRHTGPSAPAIEVQKPVKSPHAHLDGDSWLDTMLMAGLILSLGIVVFLLAG